MSAVKRAKWIEGITQSNRVLRDIAEIVTTANRNEQGIVAAENWELVYPRPFEEFSISRGELLQDASKPRNYKPVVSHQERIVLYDVTPVVLKHEEIVEETVIVKSKDLATTYVADTDYTYDAANRSIARIAGGAITESEDITVFYGTKVHRILDTIPVKVEKVLTVANPDREIDPMEYTIDYTNKTIQFINPPPADAAYMALTFTSVTGPYSRTAEDKLQLIPDLLDPTGQTFKLPSSAGDIGTYPIDSRIVASASTGLGSGPGGTIQYTVDEVAHTVLFTAGAPTLSPNQRLYLNIGESDNPPHNTSYPMRRLELVPDTTSGAASGQYRATGAVNKFNAGMPHSVEVETDTEKIVLFKHLSSLHAGYDELPASAYSVNYNNPEVTVFMDIPEKLRLTFTARGEDNLETGLKKITNRIVLKTKTEPEQKFEKVIGTDYGATDLAEELTMYVEMTKPERLVNPETGLTNYKDHKGMQQETQRNNHYIQTRMFDRWDDEKQKPQDATFNDDDSSLESKGAYVSDWTKYAWFKDWKEYMVDELDEDPGTANVDDGIIFKEVMTTGMTDEFPVQFWISTNNNRIAMVLMGDPTLDQDHFLTSFAYIGRIHPFYDKECVVKKDDAGIVMLDAQGEPILEEKRKYFQNDVAGNFALTTGSSTLPVAIGAPPSGQAVIDYVQTAVEGGVRVHGDMYDKSVYSYAVTYLTEVGESRPTPLDAGRLIVGGEVDPTVLTPVSGLAFKIRFRLPEEATGYRIYRFHDAGRTAFGTEVNVHSNYKLVTSVTKLDRQRIIEYVDNGSVLPMQKELYDPISDSTSYTLINTSWDAFYARFVTAVSSARSFESVVRDKFTGAMLSVKFSEKWGKDTATGVNDIMMFATRSGLKYQRHNASFITTEEFMRKEKSGQSRWTGKFHLSPIYIEHSYDKQRGWLDGVMAVDDSGIEHLDELIVDKDTPNEEVYKFFRVNAPYSFFNNSPNYAYGLAIIKSSLRWK